MKLTTKRKAVISKENTAKKTKIVAEKKKRWKRQAKSRGGKERGG